MQKGQVQSESNHTMVNCQYLSVMTLCEYCEILFESIFALHFYFIFLWFVLIESLSFRVNGMPYSKKACTSVKKSTFRKERFISGSPHLVFPL